MITSITYHCPTTSLTGHEDKAAAYRLWLKARLQEQFPGASVTVTSTYQAQNFVTDADPDNEKDSADVLRLMLYVTHAWETCPWDTL